jgi:hypothetical protein
MEGKGIAQGATIDSAKPLPRRRRESGKGNVQMRKCQLRGCGRMFEQAMRWIGRSGSAARIQQGVRLSPAPPSHLKRAAAGWRRWESEFFFSRLDGSMHACARRPSPSKGGQGRRVGNPLRRRSARRHSVTLRLGLRATIPSFRFCLLLQMQIPQQQRGKRRNWFCRRMHRPRTFLGRVSGFRYPSRISCSMISHFSYRIS